MATLPPPPKLHWLLVTLLSIVTVGLFLDVWLVVQAVWVRKIDPSNRALLQYSIGIALSIVGEILNALNFPVQVSAVVLIAAVVFGLVGTFSVRDALGRYIAHVKGSPVYLSGLMTLLFGPIYLQYHMNRRC